MASRFLALFVGIVLLYGCGQDKVEPVNDTRDISMEKASGDVMKLDAGSIKIETASGQMVEVDMDTGSNDELPVDMVIDMGGGENLPVD